MSGLLPGDVLSLMRELLVRTQSGVVRWEPVDDRGTRFVHTGQVGAVAVSSRDGDGSHPYVFAVLTPEGVVADSWASYDGGQPIETDLFEQLYTAAKRNATGADKLVQGLLGEIRQES